MKLRVAKKVLDTSWRGSEIVTYYFVSFELISNNGVDSSIQLLVTEEEYNSCSVNQTIEVNLKS